ncbi:insulinase family protein [Novosphingobium sp. 1949]|uniref:Insulinase family protein n=1 Tax=Novosphingobium organovorum TaxID=2930092 RepID=A0ABT0BJ28_9SPHN|nr:pitrilysin family protein [Novosphingobium organovorum]MCJ2184724.1 insulinase family protein [Novosphingobium organovorum]
MPPRLAAPRLGSLFAFARTSAIALILAAGGGIGAAAGHAAPMAAPTAAPNAVRPQGEVTRATLGNGLRVVIVRNPLAPVVTTEMNYLAGSNEVPAGFPGTAHAVEHMMFRGSPGLGKDQIAALAANMGGQFNADTTEDVTQYFFTVPVQDLDVALHIHALRMRGVDMKEAEWDKERGAIEQEVAGDLSNPTFTFYTRLRDTLFAGTPYAHTPLGTRPSFDKTSAADLKRFHDAWYAPNNAILVIAGDVDPQATLAEVRRLFGPIAPRRLPQRPAFALRPVTAQTIHLPTDDPYGQVLISYRMPSLRAKDYATALVLSQALDSKRGALYAMGLDGAALYGGFSADFLPEGGLAYAQGVFARGAKPDAVLARMRAILARTAREGVSPDLVAAARNRAIADLGYQKNSVTGLANAWSQALAFAGASSPDAVRAQIAAVTPAEVNALARRVFDPAQAVTAILSPEDSDKPVSAKGFGGAENFAATPSGPVTLPDWAKTAFAALPAPQSALHPSDFTLANGLRVIVQPETVSDTVEVFGAIDTNQDMQAAKGKEGVADVLDDMFAFGTGQHDRIAFQSALDAISAHESAGARFSLAVPAAHFATGMQLLAENELDPALDQKAFSVMRDQEAAAVAGEVASPDFRDRIGLERALLPAGDPALRYATPGSLGGLTLADIKAYYERAYRPDMTTIVIVGKVSAQEARAVAEKTFGAWRASGPRPVVDYPAVAVNRAGGDFVTPAASAVQDSVTMAQQVDLTTTSPDRYALNAGNLVLSGGFYSARLVRDLRETRGLVYTVDSGLDLDTNRGRFSVSFGSDPDKVGAARAIVVRDLTAMQQAPVSAQELHRAKGMLLRELTLGEASFGAIGQQLLQFAQDGKPLDSDLVAARRYAALTAPEIQAAFARYIRPDAFVTAVKGPAPTS